MPSGVFWGSGLPVLRACRPRSRLSPNLWSRSANAGPLAPLRPYKAVLGKAKCSDGKFGSTPPSLYSIQSISALSGLIFLPAMVKSTLLRVPRFASQRKTLGAWDAAGLGLGVTKKAARSASSGALRRDKRGFLGASIIGKPPTCTNTSL